MASVTVGMFLASINAYLNGTPGAKHHLGYGMLAREAFGLWGSYFCIMLNVFQCFVFYVSMSGSSERILRTDLSAQGTQMYFGGQAFVLILNSIFPSFLRMKNTLPARYAGLKSHLRSRANDSKRSYHYPRNNWICSLHHSLLSHHLFHSSLQDSKTFGSPGGCRHCHFARYHGLGCCSMFTLSLTR
jgi:hypothetical protein